MLHKHPVFGIVKLRKDNQVMYKYRLRLTQEMVFNSEDNCFESIVDAISEAQKEGFDLVKIKENKYYLKKGEDIRKIEVIKEVKLV